MIADYDYHHSGSRDDWNSIQCLAPLDQKRSVPVLCPGGDEVFDQSGAAGGISEHPGGQCHPATGGGLMGCEGKRNARPTAATVGQAQSGNVWYAFRNYCTLIFFTSQYERLFLCSSQGKVG